MPNNEIVFRPKDDVAIKFTGKVPFTVEQLKIDPYTYAALQAKDVKKGGIKNADFPLYFDLPFRFKLDCDDTLKTLDIEIDYAFEDSSLLKGIDRQGQAQFKLKAYLLPELDESKPYLDESGENEIKDDHGKGKLNLHFKGVDAQKLKKDPYIIVTGKGGG